MKGKTLQKIINTPKAGLKELSSLPDNEEFNVEIISKDSGKVYTVSTDAFNSNISGSSALLPNGIKQVGVSRDLQADDAGHYIVLDSDDENPVILTMPATNPFQIGDNFEILSSDASNGYDVNGEVTYIKNGDRILFTNTNDGSDNPQILEIANYNLGAFIPLSGTVSGSPVTGDIEMGGAGSRQIYGGDLMGDYISFVVNKDDYILSLISSIGGINSSFEFSNDNIGISFDNASSRGIIGRQDYTANITDLDYTQKKYVDTHIAFTTVPTSSTDTGIKGQMAIDATYLYVCVDTNTWVRTLLVTW